MKDANRDTLNLLEQKTVEVTMLQTQIQSLKYELSITGSKVRRSEMTMQKIIVYGHLDGKIGRNESGIETTYTHFGKIQ